MQRYHLFQQLLCPHPVAAALAVLCLLSNAPNASSDDSGEFVVFPSLGVMQRFGIKPDGGTQEQALTAQLDLFYTNDFGRGRVLGELLIAQDEQEVERFQAGWRLRPETTIWLGRFHNPLGYWFTQYHHGHYIQTAISRPGIAQFEDHGGILPAHTTGLLLQTEKTFGDAVLGIDFGLGAGPELDEGLVPVDVLRPLQGRHGPAAVLRLAYRPDALDVNEAGVFISYARIPSGVAAIREIRQNIFGLYGNWEMMALRLLGAVFAVENRLDYQVGDPVASSFGNGYLQAERNWRQRWTFYGRVEGTVGASDNPYLDMFPDFINDRILAGVRLDLGERHALKLEISRARNQSNAQYGQVALHWSAALP